MVELVLKRSSELDSAGPVCAIEVKLRFSVIGTKKFVLNKSFAEV